MKKSSSFPFIKFNAQTIKERLLFLRRRFAAVQQQQQQQQQQHQQEQQQYQHLNHLKETAPVLHSNGIRHEVNNFRKSRM